MREHRVGHRYALTIRRTRKGESFTVRQGGKPQEGRQSPKETSQPRRLRTPGEQISNPPSGATGSTLARGRVVKATPRHRGGNPWRGESPGEHRLADRPNPEMQERLPGGSNTL